MPCNLSAPSPLPLLVLTLPRLANSNCCSSWDQTAGVEEESPRALHTQPALLCTILLDWKKNGGTGAEAKWRRTGRNPHSGSMSEPTLSSWPWVRAPWMTAAVGSELPGCGILRRSSPCASSPATWFWRRSQPPGSTHATSSWSFSVSIRSPSARPSMDDFDPLPLLCLRAGHEDEGVSSWC